MAVLKCKMCGGGLNITADETVVECEYCGSKQTVPTADNEKKVNLFARANRLLRNCEFDKAAGIYESIVAEFSEEAEAYWGLVLCKYGIEYVDDPATGSKVPTCHRSSFDSVMDDKDFELVMEYADGIARRVYREQAKQMEELRKAIIEVSGKEEPYDIFISYKETDDSGERTLDSVIAQDIYTELTGKGYRVFFSRISLEDKLGTEYEPYIFAALNSAKLMLVVGTDYDYFNAVWVKNEWSRFLALIAKGEKKTLIPVFKNIDAYDMPKEFAKLSAQDMGKVGAMQDLLRGVDKILGRTAQPTAAPAQPQTVIQQVVGGSNRDALIQRGYMSLEDGVFDEAKGYFNDALNSDAENAEAYLGLFMAYIGAKTREEAKEKYISSDYSQNRFWQRARQFASGAFAAELDEFVAVREAKVEADRIAEEEARIAREKAEEEARIAKEKAERAYEQERKTFTELSEKRTDAEAVIKSKKAELSKLGIFKGQEKKLLQDEISALEAKLSGLERACISYAKKGDIVCFGRYLQRPKSDAEPIEWRVLSKENNKVFLISKYGLEAKRYTISYTDLTWENSSVRYWMNSVFLYSAFTPDEQAMIAKTNPGNDKMDKVFSLGTWEAEHYFGTDESRKCVPTAHAIAKGVWASKEYKTASGEPTCPWWLETPGDYKYTPRRVCNDGTIDRRGATTGDVAISAVRPALWINLD